MLRESCKIYDRCAFIPDSTALKLYNYPQYVGHFVCNPDFYIKRQGFPSVLILYTLHGSGKLIYRNKEYVLNSNHFAVIDCRDVHTYYPVSECNWDFKFIHFAGHDCFNMYEHIYSLNKSPIFESDKSFEQLIEHSINLAKLGQPTYEIEFSKALTDFMYECLLQISKNNSDIFSSVCDYIKKHYSTIHNTEHLSKQFGFSRSYFCTEFKKYTGTSIHQYTLGCKIEAAKILLYENVLTIEDIASKIGFNDSGTFIRAFKRKEGCTPSLYRKHLFTQ